MTREFDVIAAANQVIDKAQQQYLIDGTAFWSTCGGSGDYLLFSPGHSTGIHPTRSSLRRISVHIPGQETHLYEEESLEGAFLDIKKLQFVVIQTKLDERHFKPFDCSNSNTEVLITYYNQETEEDSEPLNLLEQLDINQLRTS